MESQTRQPTLANLGGAPVFNNDAEEDVADRQRRSAGNDQDGKADENVFNKGHSRLVKIIKIIGRLRRNFSALFEPSIKLLEHVIESGFALCFLPGFQVARQDEEFAPNLKQGNLIFLNDFAEMPRRIAGFERRAREVENVLLRLALKCV